MRPILTSPRIAALVLLTIVGGAVVFPAVMVVADAAASAGQGLTLRDVLPGGRLLARTFATVLLIGVLATALALPPAWLARAWTAPMLLILLTPLLLPSYLAYSGWGLLRAPGTTLGDLLIRGPASGQGGANWWPIAASRVQAVVGLVLWAWPLAAAVLIARFRRLDEGMLDSLRIEAGPLRRMGTILNMSRRSILGAIGAVALIMLGSAVPLHVAQFETYSIEIWRRLSETAHREHWRVWVAAWPLLAVAMAASVLISRRVAAAEQGPARPRPTKAVAATLFTLGLWALSVAVPAWLFATSLRSSASLIRFWEYSWRPLVASLNIAAIVAALGLVILLAVWIASSAREVHPRAARAAMVATVMLLFAGLAPGILVGAATARAWSLASDVIPGARAIADSPAIVAIAHLARFGFVPALAGVFLAATEPRDLRAIRLLDAGTSLWGFLRGALRPQIGIALAAAIATGLLSLHEIEAAVLLQPPSAAGGGMPWQMLQWLHFARMEDLSAAVLWMLGMALSVLAFAVLAARLGRGRS